VSVLDVLAAAVVAFAVVPEVVRIERLRTGSPRLLAAMELAGLAGWAVLPAAVFACVGDGVAAAVVSGRVGSGGCWMGLDGGAWSWVGVGLALVALAPVAWQARRALRAARRTELTRLVRRVAHERQVASGGSVWVVPSTVPSAYAAGVWRPAAVVTSAVLDPLGEIEQQAVLEHEAAHVRLGHPRLLVLAAVVVRAYGVLPPARRRYSALRCALEVAADEEAVRVVGRQAVLDALAQVVLTQVSPAASFADAEHLRYRIRRLQDRRAPSRSVDVVVAAVSLVLVGLFAWTACVSASGSSVVAGEVVCVVVAAVVASRPLWAWGRLPRHMADPTRLDTSTNM